MVLYADTLEEVDKMNLATMIEKNMDPYAEPKDMQILKNIFGEDFDPSRVEQIRAEIFAKPSVAMNSNNSAFMPKKEAKWDAHVPL